MKMTTTKVRADTLTTYLGTAIRVHDEILGPDHFYSGTLVSVSGFPDYKVGDDGESVELVKFHIEGYDHEVELTGDRILCVEVLDG